jgi:hypothetical protein
MARRGTSWPRMASPGTAGPDWARLGGARPGTASHGSGGGSGFIVLMKPLPRLPTTINAGIVTVAGEDGVAAAFSR